MSPRRFIGAALFLVLAFALVSCQGGDDERPGEGVEITSVPSRATRTPTTPPEATRGQLSLDLEDHDFGEQCLGFCREVIEVQLEALDSDIEFLGFEVESSRDENAFEVRSSCEEVVERGEECDLRLTFRPTTLGEHDLTLTIEHSGEASPATIELQGVGVCPDWSEPVPDTLLGLLDERVGFGAHVTGGADGCLYVVENDNDDGDGSLREAAEAGGYWIVFDHDVDIDLEANVDVAGNTTIDGRGRLVNITGAGLRIEGVRHSNVIINDIRMAHSGGRQTDLLRVSDGATGFWFHHLAMADATDEYIDISYARRHGAVGTISWTRFERGGPQNTNELVILIGDDRGNETNHLIQVTLHHNWYAGTRQRHPLVTGATVHTFNNVIQWRLWGIQARQENSQEAANVVSENDVFDASFAPPNNFGDGARLFDDGNFLRVTNPLLLNGAGISESNPSRAFTADEIYDYELDPVEDVMDIVTAAAGPRTEQQVARP